jgi:hypothetical protein
MGTHYRLTCSFDSVPDTGGSGGGPNKNIWAHPEPQAVFGMNSNFVYGANVQVACPVNFQLALGSNLQICINPIAFQTLLGDGGALQAAKFHSWLGSGQGGNMQFTMGTSANFVMGQIYDINIGPRRLTIDIHDMTLVGTVTKALGIAMILVVVVFVLAYALVAEDDARAVFVALFQLTVQALLVNLMDLQGLYDMMDKKTKKALNDAFDTSVDPPADPPKMDPAIVALAQIAAGPPPPPPFEAAFAAANDAAKTDEGQAALGHLVFTGWALAIAIPVIFEIVGEIRLNNPNPPDATGYGTF